MVSLLPAPEDERLHTPVGDDALPWKDTAYLSVLDEAAGIHLAMHMTISANRFPDTRIAVGARDGGRERVVIRREDGDNGDGRLGNSLARLELVHLSWDADHTLRWVSDADEFAFDLMVTGIGLAPNFTAMFPDVYPSGEKSGYSYSHIEQLIRARGTLTWPGEAPRRVDAVGWRDRGWGRRKTEMTFGAGWDLLGGVLPDGATFAFTAMANVDHGPDAPLPAYGFHCDGDTIAPAVGGRYLKDSLSYPWALDLEFAGGRRIVATQVRRASSLGVPIHEAEHDHVPIAVVACDYYALLADADGRTFPVFSNQGHTILADVTRHARFFFDPRQVGR
jgi:hypothetical protein